MAASTTSHPRFPGHAMACCACCPAAGSWQATIGSTAGAADVGEHSCEGGGPRPLPTEKPMRAILAYLTTKPGKEAEFKEKMTAQAKRCLANEAGCLQFDVVHGSQGSDPLRHARGLPRRRGHQGAPGESAFQRLPPDRRRPGCPSQRP